MALISGGKQKSELWGLIEAADITGWPLYKRSLLYYDLAIIQRLSGRSVFTYITFLPKVSNPKYQAVTFLSIFLSLSELGLSFKIATISFFSLFSLSLSEQRKAGLSPLSLGR